jgi:hypothetical protein
MWKYFSRRRGENNSRKGAEVQFSLYLSDN